MQKELIRRIAWLNSRGIKSQKSHVDKFFDLATFQCRKTSFTTGVCSCSSFPTEAILWKKEVEMVESVDDLETSQSIGGRTFQNLEMLEAKIASALKKIITNPYFKKRVNLEEQKAQILDRFLRGRQVACMIYECFRVTGAHEAVLDCTFFYLSTDIFSISLQGDIIHDCDAEWDQAS